MFISVNLLSDFVKNWQRDASHYHVDETQVCDVTTETLQKPGYRVQDANRDHVQARQGCDLWVPLKIGI